MLPNNHDVRHASDERAAASGSATKNELRLGQTLCGSGFPALYGIRIVFGYASALLVHGAYQQRAEAVKCGHQSVTSSGTEIELGLSQTLCCSGPVVTHSFCIVFGHPTAKVVVIT